MVVRTDTSLWSDSILVKDVFCNYTKPMITYDEPKRQANISKHGIDLAECESVFDAPMLTAEDASEAYGEQRLKSLCWLNGEVVVLVWAERSDGPHLISCRYGEPHETRRYFKEAVF